MCSLCCCTVQEKRIKEKCMLSISMCAYNSFQLLKTPFASPPPFDPSSCSSLYSSCSYYFFFLVLFCAMYKNSLYFDFSLTYVGAGMICPHIVNVSLLLGAILSWGLMWPLIRNHQGNWYPAGLTETSFKGLYGYKVCKTLSFSFIMLQSWSLN
jgi:uncharacterized oligopeptide transporter (OPT) family protein